MDCVQRYISDWIFGGQSPTSSFERAEKFSLLPEAPLRPEARGICHICHMVNPALLLARSVTDPMFQEIIILARIVSGNRGQNHRRY